MNCTITAIRLHEDLRLDFKPPKNFQLDLGLTFQKMLC